MSGVCSIAGTKEKAVKDPSPKDAGVKSGNVSWNADRAQEFGIINGTEKKAIIDGCGLNEAQNLSYRLMDAAKRITEASPESSKSTIPALRSQNPLLPIRAAKAEKEALILEQHKKNVEAAASGNLTGVKLLGDVARPAPKLESKKAADKDSHKNDGHKRDHQKKDSHKNDPHNKATPKKPKR